MWADSRIVIFGIGDGGNGGSGGDVMRRGGRSSSGLENEDNCALSFPLILLPSDRRMADQIVICTIKSHGAKVVRTHMYDFVVMEAILLIIEPFHRFVGVDMMADMKYPLKGNTVPFWAVPLLAIMSPYVVILIFYFRRRDVYDLHHSILGLLFSVLLTAVITDSVKDAAVDRVRTSFTSAFLKGMRHLIPLRRI